MDKVLLYEEDSKLRKRIVSELKKYEGQFDLVVVSSLPEAQEKICQKLISICVFGFDSENQEHLNFISTISSQYTQMPFILMRGKLIEISTDNGDTLNILAVIEKPFESSSIANAIIEGLDAIDEGMLWKRLRSINRS